jgi:hypothetical protein
MSEKTRDSILLTAIAFAIAILVLCAQVLVVIQAAQECCVPWLEQ